MKTFDLINKQNTTGMSLAQQANMELSDPMVNNNINNIQDFSSNPSVNTFSDKVSESGAGIYGSQNQRQQSVGYPQDDNSPLLQKGLATKKDSTFVKQFHPTFTGGYISKSASEIRNNTRNPKPTREMNSDRTQSNKINEKQAINLANKKGIDTKMWKASNKEIQL
jgi:hypothetical protein